MRTNAGACRRPWALTILRFSWASPCGLAGACARTDLTFYPINVTGSVVAKTDEDREAVQEFIDAGLPDNFPLRQPGHAQASLRAAVQALTVRLVTPATAARRRGGAVHDRKYCVVDG